MRKDYNDTPSWRIVRWPPCPIHLQSSMEELVMRLGIKSRFSNLAPDVKAAMKAFPRKDKKRREVWRPSLVGWRPLLGWRSAKKKEGVKYSRPHGDLLRVDGTAVGRRLPEEAVDSATGDAKEPRHSSSLGGWRPSLGGWRPS